LCDLIENIQLDGYVDRYCLNAGSEESEEESEEDTEEGAELSEEDEGDLDEDDFFDTVFLRREREDIDGKLRHPLMNANANSNSNNSTLSVNLRNAHNNIRHTVPPQPLHLNSNHPNNRSSAHAPNLPRPLSIADLSSDSSDDEEEDDELDGSTSHVLREWSTNFEPKLTRFLTHSRQSQTSLQSLSGGSTSGIGLNAATTTAMTTTITPSTSAFGKNISGSGAINLSHIVASTTTATATASSTTTNPNLNLNLNPNPNPNPLLNSSTGIVDGSG
jgi:hypothetical protein